MNGSEVPSNRDIFRRLFFSMHSEKKTVNESSVVKELLYIWKCTRIPTTNDYYIKNKIEKAYRHALQKGILRKSQP